VQVVDRLRNAAEAPARIRRSLLPAGEAPKGRCVVLAVGHAAFREITPERLLGMMKDNPVLTDAKEFLRPGYDPQGPASALRV